MSLLGTPLEPLDPRWPITLAFKNLLSGYVDPKNDRVVEIASKIPDARGSYDWVKSNIIYLPEKKEHFQPPDETLDRLTGDCEDDWILLSSLHKAQGYRSRARVLLWTQAKPGDIEFHIYNQVYDGGEWVDADASDARSEYGTARTDGGIEVAVFEI